MENGNGKFLQGDAFRLEGTLSFGATTANAVTVFSACNKGGNLGI